MQKARPCPGEIGALSGLVKCLMDCQALHLFRPAELSLPAGHFASGRENPLTGSPHRSSSKGLLQTRTPLFKISYAPSSFQAVGLGARFIKLGGLSRGERMTKYNRLLAIEEELIQSGAWGMCSSSALFSQEL